MQVHSNATTNKKQRERLRFSQQKLSRPRPRDGRLARERCIAGSIATAPKTKAAVPRTLRMPLTQGEQDDDPVVCAGRGCHSMTWWTLVQQPLPDATRSSVHRLLKRNGVSRLPKKGEQETGQDRQAWTVQGLRSWFRYTSTASICPNSKARSVTASLPLIGPPACRLSRSTNTRTRRPQRRS